MKKQFICSRNVKFDKKQFYCSVSKDSSRSFAFQPVVNNQNTETPTVNSQDGTNDPGVVPSTANVDDLTETESTQSLLLPSLTDNENLVNQATSPEKRAIKTPERLGNPIQFPEKQKITDFTFSPQCHSEKKNPLTRSEAMNSMNCESWKQTINSELDSLQKLGVYDLVDKQKDFPLIKGKWIFVTQRLPDGSISKHKARYVAKGYSQVYGENYTETFSPTVSHSTIRVLLALAAKNSMKIHQIDVKTAFLNSPIKDNIYLEQPPGSIQEGYEDKVWKLKKCLYGLKQASRAWYTHLADILTKQLKFAKSEQDPCLFVQRIGKRNQYLLSWVDDILIFTNEDNEASEIKSSIGKFMQINDQGVVNNFLGMQIQMKDGTIAISHEGYISKLLEKLNMSDCKVAKDPMSNVQFDENSKSFDENLYRKLIGSLLYLSVSTRPDIAFAVNRLAQFNNCPKETHFVAAKTVLRYLKGTTKVSLKYSKDSSGNNNLLCYSDAAWGTQKDRKSISGVLIKLNENDSPVISRSSKQSLISLSTCEAEHIALTLLIQEIKFVQNILTSIQLNVDNVSVHTDSQSAMALIRNPIISQRSKHIDLKYHFCRQFFQDGSADLLYMDTNSNIADLFTKVLNWIKFKQFVSKLSFAS